MELQQYLQKTNISFANAFTDRDKQLFMLYQDICDYFGWSANESEQLTPNRSDSAKDLDYLMAISG